MAYILKVFLSLSLLVHLFFLKWALCNIGGEFLRPETVKPRLVGVSLVSLLSFFIPDSLHQSFQDEQSPVATNASAW
jgi:hypothetical protein